MNYKELHALEGFHISSPLPPRVQKIKDTFHEYLLFGLKEQYAKYKSLVFI